MYRAILISKGGEYNMNKYEIKLLKFAYSNYQHTHSKYCEILMHTPDDFYYLTEAAQTLSESDYIEPLSDNIFDDSIDLINNSHNNYLCFELTDKGLRYAINTFSQKE